MKSRRRLRTNILTAYVVAVVCIFFWRQLQMPAPAPASERVEDSLIFVSDFDSDFDAIDTGRGAKTVYRIGLDGGGIKRLVGSIPYYKDILRISDIDCERESQQLFIASHRRDLNGFLHARLDGSGLHQDRPASGDSLKATRQIAIAPDGLRIVVSRQDPAFAEPRFGLVAGHLGSRHYASIKTPTVERSYLAPDWSPDGSEIAYIIEIFDSPALVRYALAITAPDGGQERVVVDTAAVISDVAWSPTGEWLALVINRQIFRLRPDGSDLTQLTRNQNGAWSPRWSPDGEQISFVTGSTFPGQRQLLVMDADGANPRRVAAIRGEVLNGCWV